MPSIPIRRTPRDRRHGGSGRGPSKGPGFIPPPVGLPPKSEDLDRRIRNLEALGSSVFIGNVLASYMALPGLVGFWPMSSVQRSTGNAYDLSAQGRTLTYNGNPVYTYYNGIIPYIDLDGTGDYLSRASETDLQIDGTESIYTLGGSRGLTVGGWFWLDALTAQFLISRGDFASNAGSNFNLFHSGTALATFRVYNSTSAASAEGGALSTGTWYFIVGRFVPSTTVDIFVNSTKTSSATAFSGINTNAVPFQVGASNGANSPLDGRATLCFLCANNLGDDLISSLYQTSRVLFSV